MQLLSFYILPDSEEAGLARGVMELWEF